MNDEQIVELMTKGFFEALDPQMHRGELIRLPLTSAEQTAAFFIQKGAAYALAALRAGGWDVYRPDECKPQLGCATTRELLVELTARIDVLGQLDYSTVRGVPDRLVPAGGEAEDE